LRGENSGGAYFQRGLVPRYQIQHKKKTSESGYDPEAYEDDSQRMQCFDEFLVPTRSFILLPNDFVVCVGEARDERVSLLFRFILGNSVPFLQTADKLIPFARDYIEVIVCQFAPLLAELALRLFPLTFDSVPIHGLLSSELRAQVPTPPFSSLSHETTALFDV
jgi:hypothetical protein